MYRLRLLSMRDCSAAQSRRRGRPGGPRRAVPVVVGMTGLKAKRIRSGVLRQPALPALVVLDGFEGAAALAADAR